MKHFKLVILFFIISFSGLIQSQNSNNKLEDLKVNEKLYSSFDDFYKKHIRKEAKDDLDNLFYNKIDIIKGLHQFDFNEDGLEDVLIEFSAHWLGDSSSSFI